MPPRGSSSSFRALVQLVLLGIVVFGVLAMLMHIHTASTDVASSHAGLKAGSTLPHSVIGGGDDTEDEPLITINRNSRRRDIHVVKPRMAATKAPAKPPKKDDSADQEAPVSTPKPSTVKANHKRKEETASSERFEPVQLASQKKLTITDKCQQTGSGDASWNIDASFLPMGIFGMTPRPTGEDLKSRFYADDALVIDESDPVAINATQSPNGEVLRLEPSEDEDDSLYTRVECNKNAMDTLTLNYDPHGDESPECSIHTTFLNVKEPGAVKDAKVERYIKDFARGCQAKPDAVIGGEFWFKRNVTFMGLAMRGDSVAITPGTRVMMKNLDINHYALSAGLGLYGAVPLVYAVDRESPDAFTVGLLWLSGATVEAEVLEPKEGYAAGIRFLSSEGGVRVFVLPGPTPKAVLQQYYRLTGTPYLPPIFSIGYHQCRWSYRTQDDVLGVNKGFLEHNLPCDAIWLDIDHTNDRRYFTFDRSHYADPKAMQHAVWREGRRRMVAITDPHIKVDRGYHVWKEANEHRFFVRSEDGTRDFQGHCWPGASSWIDFANPDARKWYAGLFAYDRYQDSTPHLFAWNDMNEPSVFSGPQITMPMALKHYNGFNHGQLHNMYGFYQTIGTYDGHLFRSKGKDRPFVLTRSFFAGSQRYAAVWSGDNQGKWSHLTASVRHVLQMSLCGIPFIGADVGGFFDDPDPELLWRWYQIGSLYPFFRGHSHEQTRRREPWLAQGHKESIFESLRFRYRLLPYLYTTFWATHRFGESVWRPMIMEWPQDADAVDVFDTFMVGNALVARPVVDALQVSGSFKVYFPRVASSVDLEGESEVAHSAVFYDLHSGAATKIDATKGRRVGFSIEEANELPPVWVVGGKIVPMKASSKRSTEDMKDIPYRIVVAKDVSGRAEGLLYLDDGTSTEHLDENGGKACVIRLLFRDNTLTAKVANKMQTCNFSAVSDGDVVASVAIYGAAKPTDVKAVAGAADGVENAEIEQLREGNKSSAGAVEVKKLKLPLDKATADDKTGVLWSVSFS